MAKRGGKDHFGNTASQFDHINRQNKTKPEDLSIAGQLRKLALIEKQEALEKSKAEAVAKAKTEEVRFTGQLNRKA